VQWSKAANLWRLLKEQKNKKGKPACKTGP
jgi:hypothetical protein